MYAHLFHVRCACSFFCSLDEIGGTGHRARRDVHNMAAAEPKAPLAFPPNPGARYGVNSVFYLDSNCLIRTLRGCAAFGSQVGQANTIRMLSQNGFSATAILRGVEGNLNCQFDHRVWTFNWEINDWCVRTVTAPIPSEYLGSVPFTFRPAEDRAGNPAGSSSGPAENLPPLPSKAPPPLYWKTSSPMAAAWESQPSSSSAPQPEARPSGGCGGGNSAPPPPAGSVPNVGQTPLPRG